MDRPVDNADEFASKLATGMCVLFVSVIACLSVLLGILFWSHSLHDSPHPAWVIKLEKEVLGSEVPSDRNLRQCTRVKEVRAAEFEPGDYFLVTRENWREGDGFVHTRSDSSYFLMSTWRDANRPFPTLIGFMEGCGAKTQDITATDRHQDKKFVGKMIVQDGWTVLVISDQIDRNTTSTRIYFTNDEIEAISGIEVLVAP